eukprot:Hpha_TRINITY_DN30035_c0_g1::TRINITY_DN30035_c0_g1_i1::g.21398::m.21398/K09680/coaW; type II pantothenate kinase
MSLFVAIDAGGTLCKIGVHSTADPKARDVVLWLTSKLSGDQTSGLVQILEDKEGGCQSAFIVLPSGRSGVAKCVRAVEQAAKRARKSELGVTAAATGGMVFKYMPLFTRLKTTLEGLNGSLTMVGESDALVKGVVQLLALGASPPTPSPFFTLSNFKFKGEKGPERASVQREVVGTPPGGKVLLVNMGTGTSFTDVSSDGSFDRVG